MIRRDFVLRSIQQMAQVLARVLNLKAREEYEQAVQEAGRALREFSEPEPGGKPARGLEEWIALCRRHPESAGGLMLAVADLLREQAWLLAREGRAAEAAEARPLALGLFIEALLREECFVTAPLLEKIEGLIGPCAGEGMSAPVVRRLAEYYEARGRFAQAEDALFDWLETGDPAAEEAGRLFYRRLARVDEVSLTNGGLSRAEVAQGAADWEAARERGKPGKTGGAG